jgi:predicted pyridoxine 5'-phosphate oxidase superfamily flavin-nucleotide-binding protein
MYKKGGNTMHFKFRKVWALLVAMLMLAGLAACAGETPAPDPTAAPTSAPAAEPTTAPAAADPTEAPAADPTPVPEEVVPAEEPLAIDELEAETPVGSIKDLGGREIVFLSWYDNNPVINAALPGATVDPETSTNYTLDMMNWDTMQRVYTGLNCTFRYNLVASYDELLPLLTTSVLAGDPAGDLAMMAGPWMIGSIGSDLIKPYNDYLPESHDLFTSQTYFKQQAVFQDKVWAASGQGVQSGGNFLGINMDILRSIGGEDPRELYDRGEWTWDKFLELARMATMDTDGDGAIDQFGISGVPDNMLTGFIASNDGLLVTDDYKVGFNDPKTMRALDLAYTIFAAEGLWNNDPSVPAIAEDWNRNTYAFRDGNTLFFNTFVWVLAQDMVDGVFTFEHSAVPFPKGPDNTSGSLLMGGYGEGYAIPTGVEAPEDVLLFWEESMKWYGDDVQLRDEGQITWPLSAFLTEEDGMRVLDALKNNVKIDTGLNIKVAEYEFAWTPGEFAKAFVAGTGTPAQVVEQNEQFWQGMLDTAFEPFQ